MRLKGSLQLRLVYCPELRKGIGAWGFRGEEGNSQQMRRADVCHADLKKKSSLW